MSETTASFSKFARLQGWSPSYVTKLKDAGRLMLTVDGKRVRVEASLVRIKETESGQPQHVASREHQQKRRTGTVAPDKVPNVPKADNETIPPRGTRAAAERREAFARAEMREIALARLRGELVETAAVRAAGTEAGTALRAAIENLPDHLAPILAEGDPEREQRIRAHLVEHLGGVLTEVSDKLKKLSEQLAQALPPNVSPTGDRDE